METAKDCMRSDFSERLLILHGLSGWPAIPIHESYFLCEVDLSLEENLKVGDEKEARLVIQCIPCSSAVKYLARLAILAPNLQTRSSSYEALCVVAQNFRSKVAEVHEQNISRAENPVSELDDEGTRIASFSRDQVKATGWPAKIGVNGTTSHPNIVPVLGAFSGEYFLYLVYPALPFTLETLLYFSPKAFGKEAQVRLIIFELLSGIAYCHKWGLYHANLSPSQILLTGDMWCLITGCLQHPSEGDLRGETKSQNCGSGLFVGNSFIAESKLLAIPLNWRDAFKKWWVGDLSNYDYLLWLNKLAGRRWEDLCFHSVMPWVIDFTVEPDQESTAGWRDLSKSKWRLAKGDEQLDFTYASSEMPHHVSDECLSELAVCIYKARRLPLGILRRVVRSVYEPNEYPANMQRLYQWTPDECIPEFYSDARIFESVHPGMSNLAVPQWSRSAEEFISLHRAALESDQVSQQLHHWIDLTFGFKLSGSAAISAKNVTLSTANPSVPKASGRRQIFSTPHPRREFRKTRNFPVKLRLTTKELNSSGHHTFSRITSSLEELEQSSTFCESVRHASPCYSIPFESCVANNSRGIESTTTVGGAYNEASVTSTSGATPTATVKSSFHGFESVNFQELVENLKYEESDLEGVFDNLNPTWAKSRRQVIPPGESDDIFAAGCIIAEIYLQRPLFDHISASAYAENGTLPGLMDHLPPNVRSIVESTIQKERAQRPTAAELLESRFFPPTVRAVYQFLAPLQLLSNRRSCLEYVTKMAKEGAFLAMGPLATEMCTSPCLSLVSPPYSNTDADAAVLLITSLIQALKPHISRHLIVPVLVKLLQSQESGQLQAAILQPSFIKVLLTAVGTSSYLQYIHLSILANLRVAQSRMQTAAASWALVSLCQDLGFPITLHQTLFPLLQSFGRDITTDCIDVIVGIGAKFGRELVVKHLLPPLRAILVTNADLLVAERPGPGQSWRLLAMVDVMAVLDRLIAILPPATVLRELLQDPHNVYVKVLLHPHLAASLQQCAAKALLLVCNHVGPEATAAHVLSQLKPLFEGLAFAGKLDGSSGVGQPPFEKSNVCNAQQISLAPENFEAIQSLAEKERSQLFLTTGVRISGNSTFPSATTSPSTLFSSADENKVEDNVVLVHILYPQLALLVGIERLRQCLATWLLLEQALLKHYNWKWEGSGVSGPPQPNTPEKILLPQEVSADSVNPANLLLDGVGWSIPQSQVNKRSKSPNFHWHSTEAGTEKLKSGTGLAVRDTEGGWSWFVSKDTLQSASRIGSGLGVGKDDHPWNVNSVVIHSWRAHHGLLVKTVVSENESTVLTAGGGQRGGSVVKNWKLSTSECLMEYAGHEEPVNDVCILPGSDRIASCDGTLHIWNSKTGQRLAYFDESSSGVSTSSSAAGHSVAPSSFPDVNLTDPTRNYSDLHNGNGMTLSSNSLAASLTGGGVYTCMHYIEAKERLVTGMVNGSLRFFDVREGRQLYTWRCEPLEASLLSFVSSIASSGNKEFLEERQHSTWIAVGFGSGYCRLLDYNSGSVVGQWRAHDGFITKMAVLEDYYLVSSSLDRTLCLWDLRRGTTPERLQVIKGHKHGVTSFALKGTSMLSTAGNKIGLSSLSKSSIRGEEQVVIQPQKLYVGDRGNRSFAKISTINILPFSRLFLIGTEDGFLKVCR